MVETVACWLGADELRIADCGLRIQEKRLLNLQSAIRNPQLPPVGPSPFAIRSSQAYVWPSSFFATKRSEPAAQEPSSSIIKASATATSSILAPAGRPSKSFRPP